MVEIRLIPLKTWYNVVFTSVIQQLHWASQRSANPFRQPILAMVVSYLLTLVSYPHISVDNLRKYLIEAPTIDRIYLSNASGALMGWLRTMCRNQLRGGCNDCFRKALCLPFGSSHLCGYSVAFWLAANGRQQFRLTARFPNWPFFQRSIREHFRQSERALFFLEAWLLKARIQWVALVVRELVRRLQSWWKHNWSLWARWS